MPRMRTADMKPAVRAVKLYHPFEQLFTVCFAVCKAELHLPLGHGAQFQPKHGIILHR
jgi:hypothetical protein